MNLPLALVFFLIGTFILFLIFRNRVNHVLQNIKFRIGSSNQNDFSITHSTNTNLHKVSSLTHQDLRPEHTTTNISENKNNEIISLENKLQQAYNEIQQTKKSIAYLEIINELGQKVTSSLDLKEVFNHLHYTIHSIMDAAIFELGIYSSRENKWSLYVMSDGTDISVDLPADYFNHMAEWSLVNHKEIFLNEAEKKFGRYVFSPLKAANGQWVKSILCFPMYIGNRDIGTICVMSFRNNAYENYHADMIRSLIPYTAVALENALVYQELKDTQAQLIHNEKMASLGELTAGIAHEIQNPLNFINNFSDLGVELIDDFIHCNNKEEKEEIIGHLKENLSKVVHHGKRADSIVKGMLLHSRSDHGQKEPTDINKIVEHYLSLSVHGMQAKDPSFHCVLEKNLGEALPNVSIYPQDVGRVLINLINNAFYAMNEKKRKILKIISESPDPFVEYPTEYIPSLTISTSFKKNYIQILVQDNGTGIPNSITERIFQPFFTTKPTGEGTGLGLSLSFDIIRKGHQGEITVDSVPGDGAEFKILLPLN